MVNYTHAINPLRKWGRIAFLFFALCRIAHASVLGEGRWEWVYPWPSSYALMDIEFIDENEGWIVGGSGTILHTTDGGTTWDRQFTGTTQSLNTMDFIDEVNGWAAGSSGYILKTTDGGDHWVQVQTESYYGYITDIEFSDYKHGWAVGTSLSLTTDGGMSWTKIIPDSLYRFEDVTFLDSSRIFIACRAYHNPYTGYLFASEDGGRNWEQISVPDSAAPLSVAVLSDSVFWMPCFRMFLSGVMTYKTEDRGQTWTLVNLDDSTGISRIVFLDEQNGWALGSHGTVLRTVDGGTTWEATHAGDSLVLYDFSPIDQLHCWAVGAFGATVRTTDGGETWTQQREYMDAGIGNIQHVGTDRIWALTSPPGGPTNRRGGILRSLDGGMTWDRWEHPEVRRLSDISMVNQSVGYATGYYEGLWTTYDGGENWNRIATVPDSFAHSVHASSANNVFVLGRDRLIVTYDGCQTWSDMGLPTDIPTHEITVPLPGVMLAYGGEYVNENESRGVILIRNGESPWQILCENDSLSFVDVQMTSENDLWANAYSIFSLNQFLHSNDRGATWKEIEIDNWGIRSFKMLSDEIGIALDQHYRVNVTDDGWRTWNVDTTYFQYGVSGFTLVGDQLFGTTGSAIVKREVAPELFSRLIPTPDNFILSVYPNPFNASLSIALDLPLFSSIDVSLFDILGRRADEIFSGKLQSTTLIYSTPSSMATGSYFVKATTADHSAVKKVVLLK